MAVRTSSSIRIADLFAAAHEEARTGQRPRMTYRDCFRSALRRAWRDAQMDAFTAAVMAKA